MQSPDPSSKKDNKKNSKRDNPPKDKKSEGQQPLSLLKDLPSLGPSLPQKQNFDAFDFDEEQQQKSVLGSNKYSKAE